MFDRITDIFVEIDDFCKGFQEQWQKYLLSKSSSKPPGPEQKLSDSEIITIMILYHRSNFKHFKKFYQGVLMILLAQYFPELPSYGRFIELMPRILIPLTYYLNSKLGQKSGIYYVDSTALPVCHNLRISRHKVFSGLAARGKTSTGWFFGLKLHLVFNHLNEIVAVKLTPGNNSDISALPTLTKNLTGKLFADKGYLGKQMAQDLLKRGLTLLTKVRKNMASLPINMVDKALLNARNISETIIGHIKEFSSLNLSKSRSPINAFVHILAALTSYQINPLSPKFKLTSLNP